MSDQIEVLIGSQEVSLVVEGGALALGMSVAQAELNGAVAEAKEAAETAVQAANSAQSAVSGLGITNVPAFFSTYAGFAGNSGNGLSNVAFGYGAGNLLGGGSYSNVLIGRMAGASGNAMSLSVAIGAGALQYVPGIADGTHEKDTNNVAIGVSAIGDTTDNPQHTVAVGYFAGSKLGSKYYNVCIGYQAMQSATGNAEANVAVGAKTLEATTGTQNTALGHLAGFSGGSGSNNTAVGFGSLWGQGSGGLNVALGYCAGAGTFSGLPGQVNNSTGDQNTFVGPFAGTSVDGLTGATAIGARATVSASYTVALGASAVQGVYEAKVVIAGSTADERLHVRNGNAKVEGSLFLNTGTSGRVRFGSDASIYSNSPNQISIRNGADSAYAAIFTGQVTAVGEGYFGTSSDIRLGSAYGQQGLYRPGAMTVRSDAALTVVGTSISQQGPTTFTSAATFNSTITASGNLAGSTGSFAGLFRLPARSVYADNAAALAGGLVAGDVYRTATGVLMVVF